MNTADGQRMMECFAWETFIAYNWPAEPGCRGIPDTTAQLDATQKLSVLDTFKATYELFQPTNTEWDAGSVRWEDPVPDTGSCGSPIVENASSAAPSMNQIVYQKSPAFLKNTSVIADQNGETVVYTVTINQDQFEYIRENGFAEPKAYGFAGPSSSTAKVSFPTNADSTTGYGSAELKTAWRVLSDDSECDSYVCRTAKVYDEDESDCSEEVLGLVGLHIARKVDNSPKWIWATFEHVKNTPPVDVSDDDDTSYSFYSQSCAATVPDDCYSVAVAASPAEADYTCCANILMEVAYLGSPNQLTRLEPIPALADMNDMFQGVLAAHDSVLQNYFLVGAQWAKPDMPGTDAYDRPCNPNGAWRVSEPADGTACYTQLPAHVRNAVIEGYNIANDTDGGQSLTDSCMNCHWATGIDGSFIWLSVMNDIYELDQSPD
jgi:hypothetical protein